MPIKVPGKRDRTGKIRPSKRSVVAVLQLTAMVDMFTVLVVFLLQNYATTGEVLHIPEEVRLPDAGSVKELKPSNVVVVSEKNIMVNSLIVTNFREVYEQSDWLVNPLKEAIEKLIAEGESEKEKIGAKLKKAVSEARTQDNPTAEEEVDEHRKITIQADQGIDFLTVKKIMYTVTEAGIYEINFAVIKKPDEKAVN